MRRVSCFCSDHHISNATKGVCFVRHSGSGESIWCVTGLASVVHARARPHARKYGVVPRRWILGFRFRCNSRNLSSMWMHTTEHCAVSAPGHNRDFLFMLREWLCLGLNLMTAALNKWKKFEAIVSRERTARYSSGLFCFRRRAVVNAHCKIQRWRC